MTKLQKYFISFIPSQTMRTYLSENIENGCWCPSFEDMAATVLQTDRNIFEKSEFLKVLLDEKLTEDTRNELEDIIALYENIREYIGCSRYAFECEDRYSDKVFIFNSIRRTMKFLRKQDMFYFRALDKQKTGQNRYVAELIAEKGEITDASSIADGNTVHHKICSRYVKFPIPFEEGDTIYSADDKADLLCVINAEQPDPDLPGVDSVDASIMVIPYEYREYATPEKIREHYEQLAARVTENSLYEPDIISVHHGHQPIIYAELYKKYTKGE